MTWIILAMGFLFGAVLQHARLNRYNTISGMALLEDFTVAKTIATAIGIGAILIAIEVGLGLATYHVKPFLVGSVIVGGLVFGTGMAILGYCPGTLPISLGQGSVDALFGIFGGLVAGLVYTLLSPYIHGVLGPDLGQLSLYSAMGDNPPLFFGLVSLAGTLFVAAAFWLNRVEKKRDLKWFYSGLGLAVLALFVFATSITNRVIGASSFYPYAAGVLTGLTDNEYFRGEVSTAGRWQVMFLGGAFLSGLVLSLVRREFKIRAVYENWARFKGPSVPKRLGWAFVGGFLLLFGARTAGGCTSGHVISGGMQLAVSSLVFALFVFAGFLGTGHLFYRKRGHSRQEKTVVPKTRVPGLAEPV